MFTASLDIPLSPQVQFLFFLSGYLSLHFQILEYDHICMVLFCIFYDRTCNFFFPVLCSGVSYMPIFPVTAQSCVPFWNLRDSAQCAVHPVFFTGMIDKFSSQDSSVCPHDGTDCIRIDSQIHTADDLLFYRCLGKHHFFCIGKTQEIFMVPFLQCRG